jgi:sodium transport system permease protein
MKLCVVFRKEVVDHVRDRRALLNSLVTLVLLGPLLFGVMFKALEKQIDKIEIVQVAVLGAQHAPSLVAFLENAGVRVQPATPDFERRLRDGTIDVVLRIPDDYGANMRRARPATVEVLEDGTQTRAAVTVERLVQLLTNYAEQAGRLRLVMRGLDPELVRAVKVERRDFAPPQQGAGILKMAVGYGLLAAFVGATALMIDVTAGERERGSLEPLLVTPVAAWELVMGKWLAGCAFSLLAVAVTLLSYVLTLQVFPFYTLGVPLRFGLTELAAAMGILAPACPLFAGLLLVAGLVAKSSKEAQVSASALLFMVMLPTVLLVFSPVTPGAAAMLVPVLSQNLLLDQLIRGEPLQVGYLLTAAGATVATALLAVGLGMHAVQRENVVL